MPCDYSKYPQDWPQIRAAILARADWHCEGCGAMNHHAHPQTGARVVLTIAHLDHDTTNSDPANLRAWCQKCHNSYDMPMRARHARATRWQKKLAAQPLLEIG